MSVAAVIEFERRQAREIELGFRRCAWPAPWRQSWLPLGRSPAHRAATASVASRLGGRVGRFALGLDLLARPALQKTFRGIVPVRHRSSLRVAGGRRPSEFRVRPVALALHEHLLDMVLGDERRNRVADDVRHRHRLDDVVAGLRHAFALGRIGGHEIKRVGRLGAGFAQHHPQAPASRLRGCRDSSRSRCDAVRPSPAPHRTSRARHRRRARSTAACPAGRPAPWSAARCSRSTGSRPSRARR